MLNEAIVINNYIVVGVVIYVAIIQVKNPQNLIGNGEKKSKNRLIRKISKLSQKLIEETQDLTYFLSLKNNNE